VLGLDPKWGVAGLTASAGIAGWIEYLLLRQSLNKRIGRTGVRAIYLFKLWSAAAVAAVVGFGLKMILPHMHAIPLAVLVLGTYGVLYFVIGAALGIGEARDILKKFTSVPAKFLR
jgi:putative peptidoglycan lipid II flippase